MGLLQKKESGSHSKMKDALNETQFYIRAGDESKTLSLYQVMIVPKTRTFIQFSDSYDSDGLSAYGGLMKFCINALNMTIQGADAGIPAIPIASHIGEKMAHVALAARHIAPCDVLTENDIVLINNAEALANIWINHNARPELVNAIDGRVDTILNKMKSLGLDKSWNAGDKIFSPLMQW